MILTAEKQIYDTAQKPNQITYEKAVEAMQEATNAQSKAENAAKAADGAAKTATDYITNITDAGIMVTGNSATANVQISDKVRVQADSTHFTDVESTGMKVYSGNSSAPVAQFLANGSRIATDSTHYTAFDANSWSIVGGADSPTISAKTYPVTDSAVSSTAIISISNATRTRHLIDIFTRKVTLNGATYESPTIMINAHDTGNAVVTTATSRKSDGTTAGGHVTINGLGTTNAAIDMLTEIGTVSGTQRAGGMFRVHYGTSTISKAAQLRTFGQNGSPSLEFYDTSGTMLSWYGAKKAYINGTYDQGAVVHGHTASYEMSLDCDLSSGYVAFYGNGEAIGAIPVGSSDRRTKKDIEPLSEKYKRAILKVELKDFRFDFTDDVLSGTNNLLRFGAIAQDVIEALEAEGVEENETEFVGTLGEGGDERYIINYVPFIITRLAADEDRIASLEAKAKEDDERIKTLKARLEALEVRLNAG